MASLLENDWLVARLAHFDACAASQLIPPNRNEILEVIQYYAAGEPRKQAIEKYCRAVDDLWDNFEPSNAACEDYAAVMQFVERCAEAAKSFRQDFEIWLLVYISRMVLEITIKDTRIGLHLAEHLATTLDGLLVLYEVGRTCEITHVVHKSLRMVFFCMIDSIAGARSIVFPQSDYAEYAPRKADLFLGYLGSLNLLNRHAAILMQLLAPFRNQAEPDLQESPYEHLTKLLTERLGDIENTLQTLKAAQRLPASDHIATDAVIDAETACAAREISVLTEGTVMTRDTEEYIGSYAPPYSIDPPGDPAERYYTRFYRSESIAVASGGSWTPTGDENHNCESSACALSIETTNDETRNTDHAVRAP